MQVAIVSKNNLTNNIQVNLDKGGNRKGIAIAY